MGHESVRMGRKIPEKLGESTHFHILTDEK
jgi:hypothetical protein